MSFDDSQVPYKCEGCTYTLYGYDNYLEHIQQCYMWHIKKVIGAKRREK